MNKKSIIIAYKWSGVLTFILNIIVRIIFLPYLTGFYFSL